jgi:tRNA-specific 2-thiouridylase
MRVLVALSGGVDSSAAAAMLKDEGFDISGATIIFKGTKEKNVDLARRCCKALGIDFLMFDMAADFQREVLDNFVSEYRTGKTPNPCVMCNRTIKFGAFMRRARDLGFEKIATGHYARVERGKKNYLLRQGRGRNEQSYFLYRLDQEQLSGSVMPLGRCTKNDARKLAAKWRLPTARSRKSQDICFLPDHDYREYLKGILPAIPGPVYDRSGKKVGTHKGIVFYTYGQRRGMGISHKRPYYVTKIDAAENSIYVGEKDEVYKRALIAKDVHFINPVDLQMPLRVRAKSRYFSPLADAIVEPYTASSRDTVEKIKVTFNEPQWALTPGQSVVLYDGDIVIGGGIIESILGSNLDT